MNKYYIGALPSELSLDELYLDTCHNTEGLFQCMLIKILFVEVTNMASRRESEVLVQLLLEKLEILSSVWPNPPSVMDHSEKTPS